jgi:hypothetical protein
MPLFSRRSAPPGTLISPHEVRRMLRTDRRSLLDMLLPLSTYAPHAGRRSLLGLLLPGLDEEPTVGLVGERALRVLQLAQLAITQLETAGESEQAARLADEASGAIRSASAQVGKAEPQLVAFLREWTRSLVTMNEASGLRVHQILHVIEGGATQHDYDTLGERTLAWLGAEAPATDDLRELLLTSNLDRIEPMLARRAAAARALEAEAERIASTYQVELAADASAAAPLPGLLAGFAPTAPAGTAQDGESAGGAAAAEVSSEPVDAARGGAPRAGVVVARGRALRGSAYDASAAWAIASPSA